jgi:hypothetical protein
MLLFPFILVFAQKDSKRSDRHFSKKFEELQKIKLIETLDLDEESALKFFARRNAHNNNVKEIKKEEERIIVKMETLVNKEGSKDQYQQLLNEHFNNENNLLKERSRFIKSLNDILTDEQITKMVIFERRFKENVRDLLIEKGRKRYFNEKTE